MRASFLRALILLCVLQISGAHWAVLQTVAWTGMLVTRAPQAGVEEAVRTTFDGEHPCGLCMAVEKGRKQEKENNAPAISLTQLAKVEFLQPQRVCIEEPSSVDFSFGSSVFYGVQRSLTPLTQPPRLV